MRRIYNIENHDSKAITFYDFDKEITEWLPVASEILLTNLDKEAKLVAKHKELQSWEENMVYTEVENINQHVISTRWVMTTKEIDGNMTVKARLVARGFEDIESDVRTDSPTCSKDTIRLSLSIIAAKHWEFQNGISSKL